jgi:hypothetical protein
MSHHHRRPFSLDVEFPDTYSPAPTSGQVAHWIGIKVDAPLVITKRVFCFYRADTTS